MPIQLLLCRFLKGTSHWASKQKNMSISVLPLDICRPMSSNVVSSHAFAGGKKYLSLPLDTTQRQAQASLVKCKHILHFSSHSALARHLYVMHTHTTTSDSPELQHLHLPVAVKMKLINTHESEHCLMYSKPQYIFAFIILSQLSALLFSYISR